MAVRNLRAPMAAPFVPVGRIMEHAGSFLLRNTVGSGMIRLVWKSSPPKGGALRLGNTSVGSLGSGNAPALTDPKDPTLVFPNLNAPPKSAWPRLGRC